VVIEHRLVTPKQPGVLRLEVPAGLVEAHYTLRDGKVTGVRIVNVPSFLHSKGLTVECPDLGNLTLDVAYGGNFYAIIEPQQNYAGLDALPAGDVIRLSPTVRRLLNEKYSFVHPADPAIKGLSHVQWTGAPRNAEADARNAVFYGEKAIDRSPCGTGTSARMAQLASRGVLKPGDEFVHESIIGSLFRGRVETATTVGGLPAIVPSIEGWARITGFNTIFIDDDDPYRHGFQVL
jgi:4-hydroxyproline epimerase